MDLESVYGGKTNNMTTEDKDVPFPLMEGVIIRKHSRVFKGIASALVSDCVLPYYFNDVFEAARWINDNLEEGERMYRKGTMVYETEIPYRSDHRYELVILVKPPVKQNV